MESNSIPLTAMSRTGEVNLHDEIKLDAPQLGGRAGVLLRNSLAYAALLRKTLLISNINAGRGLSGLQTKHLGGIKLVRDICNGFLGGHDVSYNILRFIPGELQPSGTKNVEIELPSEGSIVLVLQAILPLLLFQPPPSTNSTANPPTEVTIGARSNPPLAPQIDYFLHVFLPMAEKMFGTGRVRATFSRYPEGGGQVRLVVTPLAPGESLTAIHLTDRGKVTRINGYIFGETHAEARKMEEVALDELAKHPYYSRKPWPTLFEHYQTKKSRRGPGLVLWAETASGCVLGGSALGTILSNPESLAKEAASTLWGNEAPKPMCVDKFLQDQLIIYMALANGRSEIITAPITRETWIAIQVATKLTGVAFDVEEVKSPPRCIISCHGMGFTYNAQ